MMGITTHTHKHTHTHEHAHTYTFDNGSTSTYFMLIYIDYGQSVDYINKVCHSLLKVWMYVNGEIFYIITNVHDVSFRHRIPFRSIFCFTILTTVEIIIRMVMLILTMQQHSYKTSPVYVCLLCVSVHSFRKIYVAGN